MKQAVGSRIQHYRERAKKTQAELADSIGVDKGTVWRWEKGHSWPDFEKLAAVSKSLGVDPETFFENVKGKPKEPSPKEALEVIGRQIERISAFSSAQRALFEALPTVDDDQARRFLKLIEERQSVLRRDFSVSKKRDQG